MPSPKCQLTIGPDESLPDALQAAPDGALVCLREGTYPAGLVLERSVTLRGLGGPGAVTLDGNQRVGCVSVVADDVDVVIEGITLSGGSAEVGGGVALHAIARLTLIDCLLTGNRARQAPGGAAYLAQGLLTLRRCRLVDNEALDAPAVFADDIASLVMEDCLAAGEVGPRHAVIRVRDGAEVTLRRTTVMATGRGAALHASGTTSRGPDVIVADSILCGPTAIDSEPPFGAVVRVARSVLWRTPPPRFDDLGGTVVADPRLSQAGLPAPDSPAIGIAEGAGTADLSGRVRPIGASAGALEP